MAASEPPADPGERPFEPFLARSLALPDDDAQSDAVMTHNAQYRRGRLPHASARRRTMGCIP
jgi:hypothetical protein